MLSARSFDIVPTEILSIIVPREILNIVPLQSQVLKIHDSTRQRLAICTEAEPIALIEALALRDVSARIVKFSRANGCRFVSGASDNTVLFLFSF